MFCKKWTTRKEARKCILTHISCDKDKRASKHPPRNNAEPFVSNVTEKMLRRIANLSVPRR